MSGGENDGREWTEEEERLRKWAIEKLKPMYEAYPDAGKVIPAFLFGIKYADDLEGMELAALAFMAAQAGLSGARTKADQINRGRSLAPYVRLREGTDRQTTLQEAAEEF